MYPFPYWILRLLPFVIQYMISYAFVVDRRRKYLYWTPRIARALNHGSRSEQTGSDRDRDLSTSDWGLSRVEPAPSESLSFISDWFPCRWHAVEFLEFPTVYSCICVEKSGIGKIDWNSLLTAAKFVLVHNGRLNWFWQQTLWSYGIISSTLVILKIVTSFYYHCTLDIHKCEVIDGYSIALGPTLNG